MVKVLQPLLSDRTVPFFYSSPLAVAVMSNQLDLSGLAEEWESALEIRNHVRDQGSLFLSTIDGKQLEVNIKGAEKHVEVLTPLLKRMVNGTDESVGMVSVPLLEIELPG